MKTISKSILIGGLSSLILTSCITTRTASLLPNEEDKLEIYTHSKPDKNFSELTYIQADGSLASTPKQLLAKLKKKAVNEGADAIIDVKYDYQFWWPIASCTAIKYN